MLKVPFNGNVVVTQSYRPSTHKLGSHYGTDYAITHRTALIAPADGVICLVEGDVTKKTPKGIRSWIANTPSDPFAFKVGSVIKYRSLTNKDYGNFIKINHGNNISTLCAHLDEVKVELGQVVKEGELIGYSDSSGNSTGDHLHYEIRVKDVVIDPETFDYSFVGSVVTSSTVSPAAGSVITQEFIDKRLKEYKNGYWPCKKMIRVRDDGGFSLLYVRNKPSRKEGLFSGFTKSYLKPGNTVNVIYFGKGEEVEKKDMWWMSEYGNFFWAGGTTEYPAPDKLTENGEKKEEDLLKEMNEEIKNVPVEPVAPVVETPPAPATPPVTPTVPVVESEEIKEIANTLKEVTALVKELQDKLGAKITI